MIRGLEKILQGNKQSSNFMTFPHFYTNAGGAHTIILIERNKLNTKFYSKEEHRNFTYKIQPQNGRSKYCILLDKRINSSKHTIFKISQ